MLGSLQINSVENKSSSPRNQNFDFGFKPSQPSPKNNNSGSLISPAREANQTEMNFNVPNADNNNDSLDFPPIQNNNIPSPKNNINVASLDMHQPQQVQSQYNGFSEADIANVQSANASRLLEAHQSQTVDLQARVEQRQRDIAALSQLSQVQEQSLSAVKRQNEALTNRLVSLDGDYKALQEQLA